jgi:hypothetical protein
MALTDGELFSESDGATGPLRVIPTKIMPKQIAATAIVLAKLTPMAYNTATNEWAPWDANGANDLDTIRGYLMEEVEIDAADSQIANIMLAGTIHYEDILAAVEANGVEVEADLQTELRSAVQRGMGIFIEGLTQVK